MGDTLTWYSLPASQWPVWYSETFPLGAADSRFPKDLLQKADTDVALVRIGDREPVLALYHVLMIAAGVRAGLAEFLEICDEIAALDWADWRHQAATPTVIAIPSIGGIS